MAKLCSLVRFFRFKISLVSISVLDFILFENCSIMCNVMQTDGLFYIYEILITLEKSSKSEKKNIILKSAIEKLTWLFSDSWCKFDKSELVYTVSELMFLLIAKEIIIQALLRKLFIIWYGYYIACICQREQLD